MGSRALPNEKVTKEALSKSEEVYLRIIQSLQDNPNFCKTLFYKILYFSDFDYYERTGKSITEEEYRHITRGPAPRLFDVIIRGLKQKGLINEKRNPVGHVEQIRYHVVISKEIEQPKLLTSEEIAEIDRNIKRISGMLAWQASDYSHSDIPVKVTKKGEIIDYELVFYRSPMFSAVQPTKN